CSAKSSYSNCGFTLLAAVVEKASGQTFERFLHEQVFAPAGMKYTGFYGEKRWAPGLVARGYGERKLGAHGPAGWAGGTWGVEGVWGHCYNRHRSAPIRPRPARRATPVSGRQRSSLPSPRAGGRVGNGIRLGGHADATENVRPPARGRERFRLPQRRLVLPP